jgi:uncharacterized protein
MVSAWLLAMPLLSAVPQIDAPVVDLANAIVDSQEQQIAATLEAHHERTGVQLAVLVVHTTHEQDIADYAQDVFEQWGGGSAERNDGALFVLAIADRRSRLHLGYGLEPVISDAAAKTMLDDLRPALQASAYGDATAQIVDDVRARTSHLRPGATITQPWGATPWLWSVIALLAIVIGVVWGRTVSNALGWTELSKKRKKSKRKRERTKDGQWKRRRFDAVKILAEEPTIRVVAAIIALLCGIGAVQLYPGSYFILAYGLVALLFFAIGWAVGGTHPVFGWTLAGFVGVALFVGAAMTSVAPPFADGLALLGTVAPVCGMTVLFGGMFSLAGFSGWQNPGSGGSYSSSSSSSYASSSSSSYSSSSSSSYSSSSYSGGGGSSGGGGASSSW